MAQYPIKMLKDESGKPISKAEYSNLSIEEKNEIQNNLEEIYKVAEVINEKTIKHYVLGTYLIGVL